MRKAAPRSHRGSRASIIRRLASTMHTACIRVLLSLALGAALLSAGSGYARRRRAVTKLISSACGLADKRRVSPHPGHRQACSGCKSIRSCTCRNWKSKLWNFLLRLLGPGSSIRERVLGPLWLPPPFPPTDPAFHFSCESDGVSSPQAVRSPQYTIS